MNLQLNTYDKKAISSLMIAQAAMVNVLLLLEAASIKESKSIYYKNKIRSVLYECKDFDCWLNTTNDKFVNDMKKDNKVTMINRATAHITKADEMMGDKLTVSTAELGDVHIKKTVSAITVVQSALINADKIFSSSLKHSKKDMITRDTIMDVTDKICAYVELIEDIVEFLSTTMSKLEYNVVMERASMYLKLVDEESGLL